MLLQLEENTSQGIKHLEIEKAAAPPCSQDQSEARLYARAHTHSMMHIYAHTSHIYICVHGYHMAHRPLTHTQTTPAVSFCSRPCLSRLEDC